MFNQLLSFLSNLMYEYRYLAPVIALAGGFFTSFSPCSISSIPLIIGYISGNEDNSVKNTFKLSVFFSLGVTATFLIISLAAASVRLLFLKYENIFYIIGGTILIIMSMQIIGFIKVLNLGNYGKASKTKGYLGAFLTGMLGGAFSSPCTTPVLLSTIVLASTSESILYSFLIFLMYSLGYNILILIAGVSVGYINKIINSKNYIKVEKIFKILTGVFIFIIGFYMVYRGF